MTRFEAQAPLIEWRFDVLSQFSDWEAAGHGKPGVSGRHLPADAARGSIKFADKWLRRAPGIG